jgi:hypothetical protein
MAHPLTQRGALAPQNITNPGSSGPSSSARNIQIMTTLYPCRDVISDVYYQHLLDQMSSLQKKKVTKLQTCPYCGLYIQSIKKYFFGYYENEPVASPPFEHVKSKLEISQDPIIGYDHRSILLCPKHPDVAGIDSFVIIQYERTKEVTIVMKFKNFNQNFINFLKSKGFEIPPDDVSSGLFQTKSTAEAKKLFELIKEYYLIDIATLSYVN